MSLKISNKNRKKKKCKRLDCRNYILGISIVLFVFSGIAFVLGI